MEGFCRGCLIKFDDPTELLQYTEKNRRLFVYSTGLQVKRNDSFTFLLCKECYLNMKASCKFKKQCRSSDKRFKNYLALKDIGDNIDFCTFLKNNDDTLAFRLPMMSGNSTPANQKCRDDDNESTCTSIRNFMSDILQGEEVPDTEARIIREVIEEEADLLDDSLDSHWLQEDISIDTDFRLDLSFSPFSTPRSVNNDHCYTPKKVFDPREQYEQLNYITSKKILENTGDIINKDEEEVVDEEGVVNELLSNENVANDTEYENGITIDNHDNIDNRDLKNDGDLIEYVDLIDSRELDGKNALNYYIEDIAYIDQAEYNNDINSKENVKQNDVCSIDKNLAEALKNETNKAFALDDLLLSPPVFSNVTTISTPTITNILFGDKVDIDGGNSITGRNIEQYDNVEGDVDILEDFFKNDTVEFNEDDEIKNESADFIDKDEIDATDHIDKDEIDTTEHIDKDEIDTTEHIDKDEIDTTEHIFKDEIDTTEHIDKDEIDTTEHTEIYDLDTLLCRACKKQFKNAKMLKQHLTRKHQITLKKSNKYSTKVCGECGKTFAGRANLHRHMKTHMEKPEKPYEIFKCDHCPIECESLITLNMHMKTHTGIYVRKDTGRKYVCPICNAVSNTPGNFKLHQRRHSKSYSHFCNECGKGFYRASDLKKHVKCHNDLGPFICKHCSLECETLARLNMHLKTHGGIDDKEESSTKYVCNICGAKSTTLGNFNRHQKRHTKSYTHNCGECAKGFYSSFDLNNHMRSHTGERPFKCQHCDESFSLRYSLVNHLKQHVDDRRFHCDYCKKSFVRKPTLVKHIKMSKLCYAARTREYSPNTEEYNVEYLDEADCEFLDEEEADNDGQYLDQIEEESDNQYLHQTVDLTNGQYLLQSQGINSSIKINNI